MNSKKYIWVSGLVCVVLLIIGGWFLKVYEHENFGEPFEEEEYEEEGLKGKDVKEVELSPVEMKKARTEYFFKMLRDPAANRIPDNIRARELDYAKRLPSYGAGFLRKGQAGQQALSIDWQLAGPSELGGRTRALAIDQRDPDIILAGGASGGVWKSTNGGSTWQMKTDPNQNMSVSSIAQDPTNPDRWYYASGELSSSAGATDAPYYGGGIYQSTDNGESWSVIPSTKDDDNQFNSNFDYISRIKVSPTTGSVFAASNYSGLMRSTDGSNFSLIKGNINEHAWIDLDIDPNGNIIAVFSSQGSGGNPGIFYSDDDGDSWTEVTPGSFPNGHARSVIAFASSNPATTYVFSQKIGSSTNQGASFFKIDVSDPQNPVADDRSANLPDFGGDVGGVNLQDGYNMVVSVKPDDPDFVIIGGTNLFRSRDGFSSTPSGGYDNSNDAQKDEYWIGGYAKANNVSQYSGQHPDQHAIVYDPNNSDIVWSGHDGGLSLTSDITASAVIWQDRDDGYVTGQFYTVSIGPDAGDNGIMGGTQDNGSPYFTLNSQGMQEEPPTDISSGDGAYSHIGNSVIYSSSQQGRLLRWDTSFSSVDYVEPLNAQNQLFIHPYAVDPNDEGIVYYPGETTMWRNTQTDEIDNARGYNGTTTGWTDFQNAAPSGYTITALRVTDAQPSDRLYYAAYSDSQPPKMYSVNTASSSWSPADVSISGAATGAYIHDIAINPEDGDELIAVMTNYNIVGLYHSLDGGRNWTPIEGNLEGASSDGPSIRSATILPTSSETMYLVGTSTGVYSATSLSGSSTSWARESDGGSVGSIGYSIAEYIVSRPEDGRIAVGTHGRGIFVGQTTGGGLQPAMVDVSVSVGDNWKLVGSPMSSNSDVTLGRDLTLFAFSGTYTTSTQVNPQTGYWTKSRAGSQIDFNGEENTSATIALQKGWNIIGGITDTVSVSNISDPDGIRSSTPVYKYVSGSYQNASEIKSTNGYWIHANQAGNIEISSSGGSGKNYATNILDGVSKIKFQSGMATQLFFVSPNAMKQEDRERFLMPPQAPEPTLDVRTPDGLRLAEGESTELELTTANYPITVSMAQTMGTNYLLKGVTGQDTVYYDLGSDQDVNIQRPHQKLLLEQTTGEQITKHTLMPNYPNPFNPATTIRYRVASQADVQLQVFDVLGRRVRTLVNKQQPKGSYTVQFDGSNLSSGTYFIHFKAGNATRIQKMTLLK